MKIALTQDLEEFVNEIVKSGDYASPEAVIRAALLLLKAREERIEDLREEIQKGIDDIEQGRFITLDSDEEVDAFFEEIISRRTHKLIPKSMNRHD